MDASKPKFEEGIDYIRLADEKQMLQQLRHPTVKRVIAMYAKGDITVAWIERKPMPKKAEEKKPEEMKGDQQIQAEGQQPGAQTETGQNQAQQ